MGIGKRLCAGGNSGFTHNRQTAFPGIAVLETRYGLLATVENSGRDFNQACFRQRDTVDFLLAFDDVEIGEIADGAGPSPKGNRTLRVPKLEIVNQQARLT